MKVTYNEISIYAQPLIDVEMVEIRFPPGSWAVARREQPTTGHSQHIRRMVPVT